MSIHRFRPGSLLPRDDVMKWLIRLISNVRGLMFSERLLLLRPVQKTQSLPAE